MMQRSVSNFQFSGAVASRAGTGRPAVSFKEIQQKRVARVAIILGFLAVATQRIGLTTAAGGTFALPTLILVILVVWHVFWLKLRITPVALALWVALIATASVSGVLSSGIALAGISLPSLFLFMMTYSLVLVNGGKESSQNVGLLVMTGAVRAMKLGALFGVVQYVGQRAGLGFIDPMKLIPSNFMVSGYNTYWDLTYQGLRGQFKPNGVIFLEPSALSLYACIAIVFVLGQLFGTIPGGSRGGQVLWLIVLTGGFAVSASTSGVTVLAAASVLLLFSIRRNRWLVVLIVAAVLVAASFGAFNSVVAKLDEGFTGRTSTALRLTLPYDLLTPYWLQHPFFGWGSGLAQAIIGRLGVEGLQASTLMKLLVEYGIVGAVVLASVVSYSVVRTRAPRFLTAALLAAWLLPAEALLNSTLVIFVLFVVGTWRSKSEQPLLSTATEPSADGAAPPAVRAQAARS